MEPYPTDDIDNGQPFRGSGPNGELVVQQIARALLEAIGREVCQRCGGDVMPNVTIHGSRGYVQWRHNKFCGPVCVVGQPTYHVSAAMRARIMERDGYTCQACGATSRLTIDHILPGVDGGVAVESNLQVLCWSCNSRKGTGTMAQLLAALGR